MRKVSFFAALVIAGWATSAWWLSGSFLVGLVVFIAAGGLIANFLQKHNPDHWKYEPAPALIEGEVASKTAPEHTLESIKPKSRWEMTFGERKRAFAADFTKAFRDMAADNVRGFRDIKAKAFPATADRLKIRLAEADRLHDEGILSDREHSELRQQILSATRL
jgi:hypothetical protein